MCFKDIIVGVTRAFAQENVVPLAYVAVDVFHRLSYGSSILALYER